MNGDGGGDGREGRKGDRFASAIGRLLAASNGAAAALVTRKNPQKEIPNEKSALRIGRGGANAGKNCPYLSLPLSLSLSQPELRGGRQYFSSTLQKVDVYDLPGLRRSEGGREGAREFSLKTV